MKYKKRTKALRWLVSLALILSLVPMSGTTAKADNGSAYNDYLVTTETNKDKSGDALTALQVAFNDKPWYIIADNSVSATSGTVTLLAADGSFGKSKFSDNNSTDYNDSTIKAALDAMTTSGGSFANVADAIMTNNDAGGKLYLLSKSEVDALPINVKEISIDGSRLWWTRTSDGESIVLCACYNGEERNVSSDPNLSYGVRPALQLDLSAVTFLAETKTFTLNSIYTVEGDGSVTLNNMTKEQLQKLLDESGKLNVDLSDVSGSNSLKIPSDTVANMKELDDIEQTTLSVWMKEDTASGSKIAEWYGFEIPTDLLEGETSLQVNEIIDLDVSDYLNDAQKASALRLTTIGDPKCVAISLTGNGLGSGIDLRDYWDQSIKFYISQPDGWSEDEWKNTTSYYLNDLGGFEPVAMKLETKETASGSRNYAELTLLHCSIYMLVLKADQSAPAAPTMASRTIDSVTLKAIENGEYKCGDGEWQEDPTFTGLHMNMEYTFYQRLKGDVGLNASLSSKGVNISTADHVHDWSYSADDTTITATCANTDGGHGTPLTTTLTIVAPQRNTYGDGKNAEATITGSIDDVDNPTIVYKKGNETLDSAPTDAGTYTANITLDEATASVEYTIAQAETNITTDPTASEITYGQTLADSSLTDGTASVEGSFEWKDSTVAPAVADSQTTEYDVVFTPIDVNYGPVECKVKLTVNKADIAVTKAPEAKTLTYTGSAQALVTAGEATGGEMHYAVTTENKAPTDENLYTTSIPTGKEAGTYYVWYKVVGDENHNDTDAANVPVSVSKGNGAVAVAPEVNAWTSDYVFAEAVNGQEYVIVKKGETPDWSKAVTPDDGSVTFTGLTPATEYSIYTRVKETDNTLASEPEKVDVMTSLIGWETRGEAKTGETITIIPDPENAEGLTWQWYYAEENEEGTVVRGEAIKGETSSSYVVKDSDVGKYLYFVISKDGKELETGYAGPVKIAINVTVALKDWAYGEVPNTPVVTVNTGNGKVSFTYAKKGSEEPESETVPTLPGTYTVFAYVEESGDYAFGYAEADFTITKGTPEVTTPKARNLVYTGASQELVEAGVAVGGEMQYAFGTETVATQPYTTSIPTATDAGTYYVWYKAVGDENHSDSVPVCVPVVIESKESVEGEVTFNKGEGSDEIPETLVESVESSDLTEFAKTQKEESKEVKVELEITPKREADIVQTSVDGTKQIAEGLFVGFDTEKVVTEYFDIDLTKYVDDVKQDNIADTGSPIEIALKYDKTKMFDPVVVRTHKGETVEFSKLNARPAKADYKDATYYVGDGMIYLYSQFFSDYAIIYSTVKTYNVDIVTGTSDKISKTVAEGNKVDLPTGLSKSGYTFSGWYSDEAYTKVWNANDPVTADTTIYAKWTKNTAPYVPSTPVETPTPTPTPTATPTPTETPTVTPAPVKDSITEEEAASGSIKLNAGLKVYPKKSDIVVKWGKIDNADRYVIYAAYCKKGRKCAKIATLDGDANTYIFSELNGKAINTKKNIKLYVVAYRKVNGKYKKITRSITAHIVGSGSKKYSNVKGINVESTKITLSLDDNTAAPSSYTLNPVAVLKDSSKKMLLHTAEFRYVSSKSSVATVGKDGTITAKGIGTCYIYVYAQNGYAKRIKVTVK
ncbi:MAG: InlB B-repeat-containing protein [Lachnospiraceae bacterium]|nr:InlB B-repeat-containing protein [Lachnospiraceae bacterium]